MLKTLTKISVKHGQPKNIEKCNFQKFVKRKLSINTHSYGNENVK